MKNYWLDKKNKKTKQYVINVGDMNWIDEQWMIDHGHDPETAMISVESIDTRDYMTRWVVTITG